METNSDTVGNMILPWFKSHYSLNRSILTLDKEHTPDGPRSIIQLIKDNKIENAFLVDDNMSGVLEAHYHAKNAGIKLNFGLRMTVCSDMKEKDEASLKTESSYIVFLNSDKAYQHLSRISSTAASDGFYYVPRIDLKTLESLWHDDLSLGIPFYDSFLFQNSFRLSNCVPSKPWTPPTFFWEKNSLPFDSFYKTLLEEYISKNHPESELIRSQSIYYADKADFLAYLTMRCIGKRTSLQVPNLDHLCSDEFCVESYLEKLDK